MPDLKLIAEKIMGWKEAPRLRDLNTGDGCFSVGLQGGIFISGNGCYCWNPLTNKSDAWELLERLNQLDTLTFLQKIDSLSIIIGNKTGVGMVQSPALPAAIVAFAEKLAKEKGSL